MAVVGARGADNPKLRDCIIMQNAVLHAAGRKILMMGEFDDYIEDLYGHEDTNQKILLFMADQLGMNAVNLRGSC